jgi:oligopeptide transport system ATP-binding protein
MLKIKNLKASFQTYAGEAEALRGVDLEVAEGDILAAVGESGCGKSVAAQSVMQLYPKDQINYKSGEILYKGKNLLELPEKEMQKIRGSEIAMIFQDPMTSLNPTMTIGKQIMEAILKSRAKIDAKEAREKALEALTDVGIPNPEWGFKRYPHAFSGGMRQRVMIAIAMARAPALLIADEPTTALDATVQAQILDLMKRLQAKNNTSIIIITHNMGVVASIAKKVAVMYAGIVVEKGTVGDIFYRPQHPYTRGLLKSVFRLDKPKKEALTPIEGAPPELINPPKGCAFAARCDYAMRVCLREAPREYERGNGRSCRCWTLDAESPVKLKELEEGYAATAT